MVVQYKMGDMGHIRSAAPLSDDFEHTLQPFTAMNTVLQLLISLHYRHDISGLLVIN